MRMKVFPLILGLCFVVSGVLALYIECAQASTQRDIAVGHEASAIHCLDALLLSNPQAASIIQSPSRMLSKDPPSIDQKLDRVILVARLQDHPFFEPISQQDLFRFEEVFRL